LEDALAVVRALDQNQFGNPYGLVLWCLYKRLSVACYQHESFSSFERWLDSVRERREAIITTNYDTLVESAHAYIPPDGRYECLHCLDFGVRKERIHKFLYERAWPDAAESSILYLKLHGSITWLFCERCGKYGLDPIWENAWESTVLSKLYPPCPECKQKETRRIVFIPPLNHKELRDDGIEDIWNVAKRTLQDAREIVFAGFSLSENDAAVRNLLTMAFKQGNTKLVTVVDPKTASIRDNYKSVYGDLVQFNPTTWKDYLAARFCLDKPQMQVREGENAL